MAESKYAKYIITETKPNLKPPKYRVDLEDELPSMLTRLAYLDDDVIKGAFYLECVWFWKGFDAVKVEAHTHDFDEVIAFFGTNPEDPHDLGGEIELWLGDEKHLLTKSCIVFVPKGLKHCPLIIRKVDRPISHFTTGPKGIYR
jgi:hypothetical protein